MPTSASQRTIDAVWRIASAKLIAALSSLMGDGGLAKELAQAGLAETFAQKPTVLEALGRLKEISIH
jgi:hypothetical protein